MAYRPLSFDLVVDRVQPHNWVDGFKVSLTPRLQFGYEFIRDRVYRAVGEPHIAHASDVIADILVAVAEGE